MGNKPRPEVLEPITHITIENKSIFPSQKLGYFTMSQKPLQMLISAYCLQIYKKSQLYIPQDCCKIIWHFIFEVNTNIATLISYNHNREFKYQYILKGNKRQTIDYHFTLTINRNPENRQKPSIKQRISQISQKLIPKQTETNTDTPPKQMKQIKHKMMILGAGLTGKSSILKQLRYIYGRVFDESEFLAAKPHITQNLIESIRTLAIYSDILSQQKDKSHCQISEKYSEIRQRVSRMSDKQRFTFEHYTDFCSLWNDKGMRNTYEYRHTFQLLPNVSYLCANMHNYWKSEYIPTFQDLCKSRQRTTGVNKIKFVDSTNSSEYEDIYDIFDVGGLKAERRKWCHFLNDCEVIIFVVDLSGFCRLLWEDNRNNRLREDIGLFRHVLQLEHCRNSHIVCLLNKLDVFAEDIECGGKRIGDYFKDFKGDCNNIQNVIEFILNKILDQMRGVNEDKQIHFIAINAMNTECVKNTFEYIRNDVIHSPYF